MKRLLILVLLLLALLGIVRLALGLLIDEEAIRETVAQELKRVSGQEALLGEMSVEVLPFPTAVISNVHIRNASGASSVSEDNIVEIATLEASMAWLPLFSGDIRFTGITLRDPELHLEVSRSGALNLDAFLDGAFLGKIGAPGAGGGEEWGRITVAGGAIRYTDHEKDAELTLSNINAEIAPDSGGNLSVSGSFRLFGQEFSGRIALPILLAEGQAAHSPGLPFSLQLKHATTALDWQGTAQKDGNGLAFKGLLSLDSQNLLETLAVFKGEQFFKDSKAFPGLPVSLKANAYYGGGALIIRDAAFDGKIVKGKADASISFTRHTDIKLKLDLDSLDADAVLASGAPRLLLVYPKLKEQPITFTEQGEEHEEKPHYAFPETLGLRVEAAAKLVTRWKQSFTEVSLFAEAGLGLVAIKNFRARGVEDSVFLFDGVVKEGAQGPELEGQFKAAGKRFDQLAQAFGWKGVALPEKGYGAFKLFANLLVTKNFIRISELLLPIEEKKIQGSLLYYADDAEENAGMVEGVIKASDVDVDALLAAQLPDPAGKSSPGALAVLQKKGRELLSFLDRQYQLKVDLDNYKLNGETHINALADIALSRGKVVLHNMDVTYKGSRCTGEAAVDVLKDISLLDVDIDIDNLDTSDYLPESAEQKEGEGAEAEDEGWSRRPIKVEWMSDYEGDFDVSISRLQHKQYALRGVAVHGTLKDHLLTLSSLEAGIWGATLAARGQLAVGRYPTLDIAFQLLNVDIIELSKVIPFFDNVSGRFSLTGKTNMTGASLYAWVTNAEGSFALAARDILVKGLNLSGIVHAVSVVRKVADIERAVEQAYPGGNALFLSAEGQLSASAGKIATSGIALKTEFGGGKIKGYFDLHNWLMDLLISLHLDVLDNAKPPLFNVTYEGDIDNPRRKLDTSSLEAFVAKKAAGRLIDRQ